MHLLRLKPPLPGNVCRLHAPKPVANFEWKRLLAIDFLT